MISFKRSRRIACTAGLALIAIAVLSSCNLPGATTEPTQTPGEYASAQQSLGESLLYPKSPAAQCPLPGIIDYYNLCFNHYLSFRLPDGKGFDLTPYKGSNCLLLALTSSSVSVVGMLRPGGGENQGSVGFKVDAKWDYPYTVCELSGQTTLNVDVIPDNPACRYGNSLLLTVIESWSPAPLEGICKSKRPNGGSYPMNITLPIIDERTEHLQFIPINNAYRHVVNAGPFWGIVEWVVFPAPGVPSEPEP